MPGIRVLLARLKRNLLKKPFLKDKTLPAYWFDKGLSREAAYLVQVGSNDGKTGDPLYPLLQKNTTWNALFIEPVPYSYEKLKKNYPNAARFRFENVAINDGQPLTFYWVDPQAKIALPDLPYWYDQLGSFDKEHILKHFDGTLAPFIRSAELEGITLPEVLDRNDIKRIDVLHIDTEGYDWKILSQLDLQKYQPKFILFEYQHLTAKELSEATDFLEEEYQIFDVGIDLLAVHKTENKDLIKSMITAIGQTFKLRP